MEILCWSSVYECVIFHLLLSQIFFTIAKPSPKELLAVLSFLNLSKRASESILGGIPELETLTNRLVVRISICPPSILCLMALLIRLDMIMSKRSGLASNSTSSVDFMSTFKFLLSIKSSKISKCFSITWFTWINSTSLNCLFSIFERSSSVLLSLDSLWTAWYITLICEIWSFSRFSYVFSMFVCVF